MWTKQLEQHVNLQWCVKPAAILYIAHVTRSLSACGIFSPTHNFEPTAPKSLQQAHSVKESSESRHNMRKEKALRCFVTPGIGQRSSPACVSSRLSRHVAPLSLPLNGVARGALCPTRCVASSDASIMHAVCLACLLSSASALLGSHAWCRMTLCDHLRECAWCMSSARFMCAS